MGRDMCYWVELWLRLGVVGGFFHSLFRDLPGSRNSRLVFLGGGFFFHFKDDTQSDCEGQQKVRGNRDDVTRPWLFGIYNQKCHSRTHQTLHQIYHWRGQRGQWCIVSNSLFIHLPFSLLFVDTGFPWNTEKCLSVKNAHVGPWFLDSFYNLYFLLFLVMHKRILHVYSY